MPEATRRQLREPLGQLDGRRVGEAPRGREREPGHLLDRGRRQLLAVGVAKLRAEQSRERVEVPVAMSIEHVRALAALEHDQLLAPGAERAVAREVHEEVLECLLPEV